MHRALVVASLLCGSAAMAAEPPILPAPTPLPGPPMVVLDPTVDFIRSDPRAVWQNYGISNLGLFRPVVVQAPYGSFYRDTGTPFDFSFNRQREITPHVVGTPYRSAWQAAPPPPIGCAVYYRHR